MEKDKIIGNSTKVRFNIPEAAKTADGVYVSMKINAMNGNSMDAYLKINYADIGKNSSEGTKENTVSISQFGGYDIKTVVTYKDNKVTDLEVTGENFAGSFAVPNQRDYLPKAINKIKEQVIDFPPQPVITRDNVTMQIDTVVYFEITDPKLYTYGVERPLSAIENLTATTLRNIIGDLELDNTLTSRDTINGKIRVILDEATDAWGIKVIRVELKNILPPREIQDAMEKQMKAERERRARILDAEGEKRSQILVAEGMKESAILKADAVKEQKIREAQGEAEAILTVQRANADALKMLNEASPTDRIIQLKSLEAFGKAADGKATKIIIPSDIQGLAGNVTAIKELWKDDVPKA